MEREAGGPLSETLGAADGARGNAANHTIQGRGQDGTHEGGREGATDADEVYTCFDDSRDARATQSIEPGGCSSRHRGSAQSRLFRAGVGVSTRWRLPRPAGGVQRWTGAFGTGGWLWRRWRAVGRRLEQQSARQGKMGKTERRAVGVGEPRDRHAQAAKNGRVDRVAGFDVRFRW